MEIQEYITKKVNEPDFEPTYDELKSLLEDHIDLRRSELHQITHEFYFNIGCYIFYQEEYSYKKLCEVIDNIFSYSKQLEDFIDVFGYNDQLYGFFKIADKLNEEFEYGYSYGFKSIPYEDQYTEFKNVIDWLKIYELLKKFARTDYTKAYFNEGESVEDGIKIAT